MPTVYAQHFELLSPVSDSEAYRRISDSLRSWVGNRWPEDEPWFDGASQRAFQSENGSIFRWQPYSTSASSIYDFTWRHPSNGDPDHSWASRVTYCVIGGERHVSIRISNDYEDTPVFTSRPRLVLSLCERFTCRTDGRVCTLAPAILREQAVVDIVHHELLDQDRRHPVLILTPRENGSFVIDPQRLGEDFASLAALYVIDRPQSTYALSAELGGKELSCFNGALRLYLPKFCLDSQPRAHPLYLPRQLENRTTRSRLAQALAKYTTLRYQDVPDLTTLRDKRAVKYESDHETLLEQYEKQIRDARADRDNEELALIYAKENEELKKKLKLVASDLRVANETVDQLKLALRYSRVSGAEDLRADEEDIFEPESVHDVVERIDLLFEDSLLILPSAFESALASPYSRPKDVMKALESVARVSKARMAGPLGKNLKDAFLEDGVDYRIAIAETTPAKLRQQFRFVHEGTMYVCEEHLCLGGGGADPAKCLRIHISTNGEGGEERIVVGYVGRHLDVLSTN